MVAGAAAIQQHLGMQPAQIGQLDAVGHLLGDLASDGELPFGFLPPASGRGSETGAGLH